MIRGVRRTVGGHARGRSGAVVCRWIGAMARRGRVLLRSAGAVALLSLAVLLTLAASRARFETPASSFLLRDRHGRFVAEIRGPGLPRGGASDPRHEPEAGYWPVDSLPPRVVAATLAVEDRRFRSHPGIDPIALARALAQNLRSHRRVSGASTVAMQVARMQRPGPRVWWRKAVEGTTALLLTARYGRDRVLAQYLRLAPYGNCIHGIACAARRYFDKPVEDLSWAEIAFLAAIPQAPGRMNPFHDRGRTGAVGRGRRILDLLRDRGVLGPTEYAVAREQITSLVIPPAGRRPVCALHLVLRLENELKSARARTRLAGRTILDLTIDLDLQAQATRAAAEHLCLWESRGAGNAAIMVVDPNTREVLASVGSSGYFDDRHFGAIDYTRVARSPGSLLKPFFYADALERGLITPATILDDLERGAGGVENADERFLGPCLPRVALANSRNVPAVELLRRLGTARERALLSELGLDGKGPAAARAGLGLAIGGIPTTLEQAVSAYTVFPCDGLSGELVWLRRSSPAQAQPDGPERSSRPASAGPSTGALLSPETARQITLFLSDPQARLPGFPRMGATEYPFAVAVKTGTSTNYRDAWTIAWSRRLLVGAWVGRADARPMERLSGAVSAAEMTRDLMLELHPREAAGLENLSFPPPRGHISRRVCALTGKLATPACPQLFEEWFAPGGEPVDACAAHRRELADRRNGRAATSRTPAREVVLRSYVDLAPQYAAWAAEARLPGPFSRRTASGPSGTVAGSYLHDPAGGLAGGDGRVRLRVTQPESGARLLRDPETPPELATVALRATVDPPTSQIVWYVDGAPFTTAAYPYTARWPIAPGEHVIEARLTNAGVVSNPVRIVVE